MGFEIDFLPVGEESRSGDAIALRYGNLYGPREEQTVIVVDGGFEETGKLLVDHIRTYYETDYVDLVVSTHPDQDHVSGLKVVLNELMVGELWMHLPWRHSDALSRAKQFGFRTTSLPEVVEKSLQGAGDLESIARNRNVPIVEPFTGTQTADGSFVVLGPTQAYYEQLLAEIEAKTAIPSEVATFLSKFAAAAQKLVPETLLLETLTDGGETSPRNNTSTICHLEFDGRRSLFTADAGIPALEQAVSLLERVGFQPGDLRFVQVPHHGSRRNVGPSVLNRLLGSKGKETTPGTAFVSAANKGAPKHPAKKVVNAFRRRGYKVVATQGSTKRHHHDAPPRTGWSTAEPLPFYTQVEEDED